MTREYDETISQIAEYVNRNIDFSEETLDTAFHVLIDSIGCGVLALNYEECRKLIGPNFSNNNFESGSRVIGTDYVLDPIQAAFNLGAMIRWLDFNDTWLAAEWGHPSDNIGSILPLCEYMNRNHDAGYTLEDVLGFIVKAHEIQGILALENSLNRVGLDHVFLVKVASTAVSAKIMGGDIGVIKKAVSNAFVDGGSLRTYRHFPNTGSRKSWAAGDAASRGINLALMSTKGEMGYPTAVTAGTWGFEDVLFNSEKFNVARPFESYVMDNILFKVAFPAEFHAQTAGEAAIALHESTQGNTAGISRIHIETQEAGKRIIDKEGPLTNPADRDHCIQYIVALGLLYGDIKSDYYEDEFAMEHPEIDALRELMTVEENEDFTKDYFDADKRYIANAVQIFYDDGTSSERVFVEVPLGHRERRQEAMPEILDKYRSNLESWYGSDKGASIYKETAEVKDKEMEISTFIDKFY